jgi:hypothetical protein
MALVLGEMEQALIGLGFDSGLGLGRQGGALGSHGRCDQHGGAQARPNLTFLHGIS